MLSVITPTHNRSQSAARLAATLDDQECIDPIESIFVLDGCVDDTRKTLESLRLKRPICIVETPGLGAAAARNRGSELAHGDLLLFLDDDIIPQPGALDAHIRSHGPASRMAVVGPCPYAPEMPVNPLDFMIRDWWRMKIEELSDPDHEFTYQDCCTGNLSLHKRDFEAVRGFDESFEKDGREDYELGVRLIEAGIKLRFAGDAVGYHYPRNRPKSLLRKWYTFGRADIYFATKHPELFGTLLLARRWEKPESLRSRLGMLAASIIANPLRVVDRLGTFFERKEENLWNERYLNKWLRARDMAYLLGAVSAAGGARQLDEFVKHRLDPDELPRQSVLIKDIDLLSTCRTGPNAEKSDRIFVIGRDGKSISGWAEVSCQDATSRDRLAKRLGDCLGLSVWQSRMARNADHDPPEVADIPATGLNSCECVDVRGISAIVLSDGQDADKAGVGSTDDWDDMVFVDAACEDIRSELGKALTKCGGDVVAILKWSDLPDAGWAQAAAQHFRDESVSCVITPVITRDIASRGDELYSQLVRFDRVRSWECARLTDWLSSSGILKGFAVPCHRLLMRKSALSAAIGSSSLECRNSDDLVTDILYSALHLWQTVVYEPRAIVWTDANMARLDVQRMAIEHHRRIYRVVAGRMSLKGTGRIRALRTLFTLRNQHETDHGERVDSWMSAGPYSRKMTRARAALNGILEGSVRSPGVSKKNVG